MSQWTLVTTSRGKLEEYSRLLGREISSVNLDLPEMQALDPEDVVRAKASAAFELMEHVPVLVEDTGLAFEAWNGLPGALVKWFVQSVGPAGACQMLNNFNDRRATACTAIALCDGDLRVFVGKIAGTIADAPRGENGFGWDSIFIPDGATKTFSEMDVEEKDRYSMRRLALEELLKATGTI